MEHPEGHHALRITNLEIDTIVKKIMSLSIEGIDKVWFETGWIDSEAKNDNRKALPDWRLKKIKSEKDFAEETFINLLTDDPYQELRTAAIFLKNLSNYVSL